MLSVWWPDGVIRQTDRQTDTDRHTDRRADPAISSISDTACCQCGGQTASLAHSGRHNYTARDCRHQLLQQSTPGYIGHITGLGCAPTWAYVLGCRHHLLLQSTPGYIGHITGLGCVWAYVLGCRHHLLLQSTPGPVCTTR